MRYMTNMNGRAVNVIHMCLYCARIIFTFDVAAITVIVIVRIAIVSIVIAPSLSLLAGLVFDSPNYCYVKFCVLLRFYLDVICVRPALSVS